LAIEKILLIFAKYAIYSYFICVIFVGVPATLLVLEDWGEHAGMALLFLPPLFVLPLASVLTWHKLQKSTKKLV
jgi:hypothetical protein